MNDLDRLLRRTRRLWLLEHSARGLLLTLGWSLNAWLLCLLLSRAMGLPGRSGLAVACLAAMAAAGVVLAARRRTPPPPRLARMLDERVGTHDLFASALEFQPDLKQLGALAELTCERAGAEAAKAVLRSRWALGPARQWAIAATCAAFLCAALATTAVLAPRERALAKSQAMPQEIHASAGERRPAEDAGRPAAETPPSDKALLAKEEATEPEKPAEETVKITNEMIDKYLKQVPAPQEIDLEGVTPIRWDDEELSGKSNPQTQRGEDEKIDPVKLDAALLKDLQEAKKTKDAGKQEGGVDVIVMGETPQGTKAKGKPGGKDDKGSLAGAVSKDPRGKPTRMAAKPPRAGMEVRSAARAPVKQPGQERPMSLLDFLAALRRAQSAPVAPGQTTSGVFSSEEKTPDVFNPQATGTKADRVVHQEPVPDSAARVAESYFDRLRKADR
jgi:hypothetical protein